MATPTGVKAIPMSSNLQATPTGVMAIETMVTPTGVMVLETVALSNLGLMASHPNRSHGSPMATPTGVWPPIF